MSVGSVPGIAITEEPLTASMRRTLYGWSDDVYGLGEFDKSDWQWRTFPTGFLLTVDGEPASYFRALRHTCRVDGRSVDIGGIGGLVTRPEYQRRGYGSRLVMAV